MGGGQGGEGNSSEEDGIYVAAFRRLPEQSKGTIRFFDKVGDGELFTVYKSDALLAAREVFQTNAAIKSCKFKDDKGEETRLEYAYIKRNAFEPFVRDLLLVRQYRVEVYVNVSKSKSKIEWSLKYKASPGNLAQFEDILFANSEITVNNGVMGIRIGIVDKAKTVGIAHVNLNEGEIHLLEFAENDSLTNLESVLVQLSPKEAVFPTSASQSDELSTLRKIMERHRILTNELKSCDFDQKDVEQDMTKLLQVEKGNPQIVKALPDFEKKMAVSALAGVIKYLELLSGEAYQNQFRIRPFDSGLYVKMDSAACRALHLSLNLLEKRSRNDVNLLNTVDKCRTAQGHRLMAQMLRQPLLNKEKLEERYDLVQILVEDVVLRHALRDDHLRKVPDCQSISRKLFRQKASLQDCFKAYVFLTKMHKMLEDLKRHDSVRQHVLQSCFIEPLDSLYEELAKFKELVESTVDLEMAEKGEFMVRPDFDESLKELKDEMDDVESDMGDLLCKVAKELGLEANKSMKLESNNVHGYFFRVTMKDEKAIRGNKKFEILQSARGGVGFRNSRLEQLSNSYINCRSKYETAQKGIVTEVSKVAADYHSCFEQLGRVIAELDVFTSFAYVSGNAPIPYVRPELLPQGSGRIRFEGLRHPCIESLPNINFIPNDLDFEQGRQMFYIITGPNMGGKSTFLRSVGIATLLAHVGCFVPASVAEISMVDAILARVGASDSLIKGVSTFMAEMVEASYILKTATSNSLVIVDELGRGTSTYDGFGLCWAISKHLAEKTKCYCVMATHFHELTSLADEVPDVVNYHVTAVANDDGLVMLYKIEKGPCDRSFGIHVANYVGFPNDVLKDAKDMSKLLEDFCQEEITDDNEIAVQARRERKLAGQQVIDDFMCKIREFCIEQADSLAKGNVSEDAADTAVQQKVQELLEGISQQTEENPYLSYLVRQATEGIGITLTDKEEKIPSQALDGKWYKD